ncbi:MAG: hypothetical protein K0V04_03960 [Deltaproteobacteria bacterium]|nr:hypothetical protein [Deltaproteobacteria bacterium]
MSSWADGVPGDRPARLWAPHGWPMELVEPLAGSRGLLGEVTVVRGISMNDGAQDHAAIRATLTGLSEGGRADSIGEIVADARGVDAHVLGAIPYRARSGFTSDAFLVKHGTWVRPLEDPTAAADALLGSLDAPRVPDEPGQINEAQFRAQPLALTEPELEPPSHRGEANEARYRGSPLGRQTSLRQPTTRLITCCGVDLTFEPPIYE